MTPRTASRLFPRSLRGRLMLMVFLAIVPALVVVVYSTVVQRRLGFEMASNETLQVVRLAGAEHDRLIDNARQLLLTLAQLREVRARDAESCQTLFDDLLKAYPAYANFGASDIEGNVFAAVRPSSNFVNIAQADYFQKAIETEDFIIGDYDFLPGSAKATLHLAYPVRGRGGRVSGVVVAALDLDWVHILYAEAKLPEGSSYTIMNRERVTLMRHPDPENEFIGQVLPLSTRAPRPASYYFEEHVRQFTGRDGVDRLYGYSTLGRKMGERSALMTVGIPVRTVLDPANRLLRRNLGLLVLAGTLAFLAAWVGGNAFILQPVQRLLQATQKMESGDLAARTGETMTTGELGHLSMTFDHMAEGLQRQFQERVRAEEALRQLNLELENRVEARTRELKRSNEALEQFAYVASHDLREPLRMVTSYMALLEKRYGDRLDQDAREFIGYAVDGADRMHRLIGDLLAYSQVQTKAKPFEVVVCHDLLREVIDNLQVAIAEKKAVVEVESLPTVRGDATQLSQLFQNLIANAIKFRGDAPPRIKVSAQRDNGNWVFSVSDNGIGIPEEHSKKIFIIFQRLHARDRYPGTGIGLSICQKIVERHGGSIWVSSVAGEGSTFFFTLPVNREEEPMGEIST